VVPHANFLRHLPFDLFPLLKKKKWSTRLTRSR
jgi:hypothetical protein